jgi:hypothetical protein
MPFVPGCVHRGARRFAFNLATHMTMLDTHAPVGHAPTQGISMPTAA